MEYQVLMEQMDSFALQARQELEKAQEVAELERLRVQFLGKKGVLTTRFLKQLGKIPAEQRPIVGEKANQVKQEIQELLESAKEQLACREEERYEESLWEDTTLPGARTRVGFEHLVKKTQRQMEDIFLSLGYRVMEGPEIEHVFYNFEALNTPEWHPARDEHDSFYIEPDQFLLRTHTSPVQIRTMEKEAPPLAIVAPGKVYRSDYDATHLPMFSQFEGLVVDEGISVTDLKGTLEHFVLQMFGSKKTIRLRPSFFPFTEPSFEVDVSWEDRNGQVGWLEVLGAGMVDPNVFKAVGYDPEKWSGFAFGMGIDRITALKYGLTDIRDLVRGDIRFLRQE
ncbi:MAG TPA: phenylalanine--tRNA ligase subunit alpha [Thermotogota bacterium]|nr:phenylalanine--tRNA ligase subunit alpha [Thermotogota bacterium]HRW92461.1 phenylalanine--tRNA ligase subunit alpha [Thermotogota bacterium]